METKGWTERDSRYSIDWPLLIEEKGMEPLAGRLFDISMGGCALLTTREYLPGTELRLLLTVPDIISERVLLPNPMPIHVKVVWCRQHLDVVHVGIEFKFLSPIIRRSFVEAFQRFFRDRLEAKGLSKESTS